ncbi:MAG TPA: YoaK family protein [Candidatus Nanopelagicales bacterium]|nr:YoaK family protein [Candidatus Nanopelagicales bacterium]
MSGAAGVDAPTGLRLAVSITALLAAVSGCVDVVSLVYAEVFVANQTGNLVVVAAASLSDTDRVWLALTALVAFTLGVLLAAVGRRGLRSRFGQRAARETLLVVEVVLVLVAGVLVWHDPLATHPRLLVPIALLALAQGIQAVLLTRLLGRGVRTVAVTGPLTDALVGAVESAGTPMAQRDPARRGLLRIAVATPAGYALGALLGALVVRNGLHLGLAVAVLLAIVAAVLARRVEHLGLDLA